MTAIVVTPSFGTWLPVLHRASPRLQHHRPCTVQDINSGPEPVRAQGSNRGGAGAGGLAPCKLLTYPDGQPHASSLGALALVLHQRPRTPLLASFASAICRRFLWTERRS